MHVFFSRFFDNIKVEEAITRDREAQEAIQKKVMEEITIILEQLALVSKESDNGPTMSSSIML